ncbi:MAG TPA: hypothetical protein DHV36_18505 [Desulfobacteraceae bacterium]|nr:hypothetical protein [Desulfobacteraceae bacterium]|tara:strand:+ start:727 stop:1233 length:507 start_codon:yes stop_codon:yes gene_type:complete
MQPAGVVAAFILLPVFGFPVSPLLALLGLKFGPVSGALIMCAIMPLHLVVAFWVTRNFLYDRFHTLVRKKGIRIASRPDGQRFRMAFVFMAVPGLSYTLKNHLLPLSGMTLSRCVLAGWTAQAMTGVPFVVLGYAVSGKHLALVLAAVVLVSAVFTQRKRVMEFLKKR